MGDNGAGKTTLLKIIMGILSPSSGTRSVHRGLKFGYFSQHHVDQLDMRVNSVELLQNSYPGKATEPLPGQGDWTPTRVRRLNLPPTHTLILPIILATRLAFTRFAVTKNFTVLDPSPLILPLCHVKSHFQRTPNKYYVTKAKHSYDFVIKIAYRLIIISNFLFEIYKKNLPLVISRHGK